jgi:hypothetical protein
MAPQSCAVAVYNQLSSITATYVVNQCTEYDCIPVCVKGVAPMKILSPLGGGVAQACNFTEDVSIRYNAFDKDSREVETKQ